MMISKNPLPQNTPEILKAKFDTTIEKVVRETYPAGKYRSRKLDFATLTKLLVTMDGGSLSKELHSAGLDVSASAFVQRRKQLEWRHFERILEEFNDICEDAATFNGYRVFAVDGTSVNLARDPSADTFMLNNSMPKGYNQLHVTPIYDVLNKTYHDCCIQPQPKQDEIGALRSMLLFNFTIPRPSIIVGDRGFESYNLFTHLQKVEGMEFIIRVKQEKSAMKLIRDLPMQELDVDVSGEITTQQTKEDKEKGRIFIQTHANPEREYSDNTRAGRWDFPSPHPISFRVVRFQLNTGVYETLATSLPREKFTADNLRELYHARWGIETAFREMKYNLGIVNLHGKSQQFAVQEIVAAMLLANFTARVVNEVVMEKASDAKHEYAVNIKMATYLCKRFLREPDADGDLLMHEIAKFVEPVRPDRSDERKILPKSFKGFVYRVPA